MKAFPKHLQRVVSQVFETRNLAWLLNILQQINRMPFPRIIPHPSNRVAKFASNMVGMKPATGPNKKFFFTLLQKQKVAMRNKGRDNERQCKTRVTVLETVSKLREFPAQCKNRNNQCDAIRHLSEIKLKRTDTTLDLSQ